MENLNKSLNKLEYLKHLLKKLHGSNVSSDYIDLMLTEVNSIEDDIKTAIVDFNNANEIRILKSKQQLQQVLKRW